MGALLILSLVFIGYFGRETFRRLMAQRREYRVRQRQRQQFWGYE